MPNEAFFLGIKLLEKIAKGCKIDDLKYLSFEGLAKAISRECGRIESKLFSGCFKVIANGEELIINCSSGKEIYVKSKLTRISKTLHYEELAEIRRKIREEIVKCLNKLHYKYRIKHSRNIITFTPWSMENLRFSYSNNVLVKTSTKPLGTYSNIKIDTIALNRENTNEVTLKNDLELSIKNGILEVKKHKYVVKVFLKNLDKTPILVDDGKDYFVLKSGENVVYGVVNNYIVFEGFPNLKLELDFLGGTLWFPAYLTVNAKPLNYDETFEGEIPLWISYCSKTHGISIHTDYPSKIKVKGDIVEIKEARRTFISLHRGCWDRGGINWFSVANMLKPVMTTVPSNIVLTELQPKHVIVVGLSFNKNVFETTLYNMLNKDILVRMKIPWKIVGAEKRSAIKNSFLGVIDYDYNVAYIPLSSNEIVKVHFEIRPFTIVRSI